MPADESGNCMLKTVATIWVFIQRGSRTNSSCTCMCMMCTILRAASIDTVLSNIVDMIDNDLPGID